MPCNNFFINCAHVCIPHVYTTKDYKCRSTVQISDGIFYAQ